MKEQIKKRIRQFNASIPGFEEKGIKKAEWILTPLSQISIICDSIQWTWITERYLELTEEEDFDMDDSDAESGMKEWYD